MPQTILFTLFDFSTPSGKWFGLSRMGLGTDAYGQPAGLEWLKQLGSGGARGFGLWPNWGGYALLAAFPSEGLAKAAPESELWRRYTERSTGHKTLFLQPQRSHGLWDGVAPFRTEGTGEYVRDAPVAVLTRARIRTRALPAFWRRVSRVSDSALEYPERTFSVGVGELPVVQQATLSTWTSGEAMEAYAYRSEYHSEVVKLTRARGWYKEELFCRFRVLD